MCTTQPPPRSRIRFLCESSPRTPEVKRACVGMSAEMASLMHRTLWPGERARSRVTHCLPAAGATFEPLTTTGVWSTFDSSAANSASWFSGTAMSDVEASAGCGRLPAQSCAAAAHSGIQSAPGMLLYATLMSSLSVVLCIQTETENCAEYLLQALPAAPLSAFAERLGAEAGHLQCSRMINPCICFYLHCQLSSMQWRVDL